MTREHQKPLDGSFDRLGLNELILKAINEVGYEAPTPIQAQTIPALLAGNDLVGQAQTGTGKTAAFALPILQALELDKKTVQALVLTPTRELALQVAEAVHTYSKYLGNVRVLPVYGGHPIHKQLERLKAGVHIVVGTPGRVMDHLRRGTLNFDALKTVVLDEADEMLRMGFIEDVEWILGQAPDQLQVALFSATMPKKVRNIADRYLKEPIAVEIEHKTLTVPSIEQRYMNVSEQTKLDTLTHILEFEEVSAVLVFAHTKTGAASLAERLQARGYAAEALHGDMSQAQREAVVRRLRGGQAEIVVATDVAARGLDVEQISHVINYDVPYDPESYVHRIGRTGRAGREGKAVLFVTPRQKGMLRDIERFTGQRIEPLKMPTQADVAARRITLFKESIRKTLAAKDAEDLELYLSLVEDLVDEGFDIAEVAAAAARLARGDKPLAVVMEAEPAYSPLDGDEIIRLYIDSGHRNGLRPADVVGAIATEADVPGSAIGSIDIYDRSTFVEIPARYKEQVLRRMAHSRIRNRPISIKVADPDRMDAPMRARGEREGQRQAGKRAKPDRAGGRRQSQQEVQSSFTRARRSKGEVADSSAKSGKASKAKRGKRPAAR